MTLDEQIALDKLLEPEFKKLKPAYDNQFMRDWMRHIFTMGYDQALEDHKREINSYGN